MKYLFGHDFIYERKTSATNTKLPRFIPHSFTFISYIENYVIFIIKNLKISYSVEDDDGICS